MKKGLLVALFGFALVAVLALPQTSFAATPYQNTAEVTGFTGAVSGPVSFLPGTVVSSATVWLLPATSLSIVKGVQNITNDPLGFPSSQVPAFSGDVIEFTLVITNNGEEQIDFVTLVDTYDAGAMITDNTFGDLAPGGRLVDVGGVIRESGAPAIVIPPGPGTNVVLVYRATMN